MIPRFSKDITGKHFYPYGLQLCSLRALFCTSFIQEHKMISQQFSQSKFGEISDIFDCHFFRIPVTNLINIFQISDKSSENRINFIFCNFLGKRGALAPIPVTFNLDTNTHYFPKFVINFISKFTFHSRIFQPGVVPRCRKRSLLFFSSNKFYGSR